MKTFIRKLILTLFLLPVIVIGARAQQVITGIIKDGQSTIPGVSIAIKGTMVGVTSNIDGEYSITTKANDILVFSFMGYTTQEVAVNNQNIINVQLESNISKLDEVIVVGYGTVKKSDLTGSVTQVGSKELTRVASANISQAIQGNVSGLWANQSDNSPGASTNIQLRGSNSFSGNSPLYIIDGFPLTSTAGVNSISPSDIESISVLKDASSTAIYGARAANGVIVITTKSGKAGKNNLEINAYYGIKSFANRVEMMNGEQYINLRKEAFENDQVAGGFRILPGEQAMLDAGQYTDWWKEMTGTARPTQNYQLTFTNGTDKTKIMIGANFYNEKGILNNTDFLRGGIRSNISHKIGNLMVTSNTSISLTNGQGATGESVLYSTAIGNPLSPLRDANGKYYTMQLGVGATPITNPVLYNEQVKNRYTQPIINSAITLAYQLADGLSLRSQLSGEFDHYKLSYYVPREISSNHTESGRNSEGLAKAEAKNNFNWISETTVNYQKTIANRHAIEVLGGFSAQQNRYDLLSAQASGFFTDLYEDHNMSQATGAAKKPTTDLQEWSMLSYFGRVIYTLDNKYIVTANFRADGSSRFGKNNKWGYFPSTAVAWKLSEENFIKQLNLFDELKLRGSFGFAGNASAIDVYATQGRISKSSYNWNGAESMGYYFSTLPSHSLKWETTRQIDLGLDFSILNRRLNVAFDYYHKNTYDLIRQIPILAVSGFQKSLANMGELENQGVELSLSSTNINNEVFKWSTTFTAAHNSNTLKSLGDGTTQIGTEQWVGKPLDIGRRYMLEADGIWQLGQEVEAAKQNRKPGDVRYVNKDNKDVIDNGDYAIMGRLTPVIYGSLSNDFAFAGFDLNVFITYEAGRDIYNGNNNLFTSGDGLFNNRIEMLDRWTPTNPSNKYPRASFDKKNRLSVNSSEFLESADFIKLKSITLGYTLPKVLSKSINMEQVRFYVSGINLLCLTGYSGFDPENGDTGNTDRIATYPMTRTIAFGLNIKF